LLEHIDQNCKDGRDDELLLFDKQFEDEFTKLCEKIYVEEHKILSNHVEEMEHIDYNCEYAYMDDDSLFLNELFKDECDHSGEKIC